MAASNCIWIAREDKCFLGNIRQLENINYDSRMYSVALSATKPFIVQEFLQ